MAARKSLDVSGRNSPVKVTSPRAVPTAVSEAETCFESNSAVLTLVVVAASCDES